MKLRHPAQRSAAAFTLLEILLAMVAFAIVLAAINTIYYAALRLRNKATESFDKAVPLQHTLAVMKRDLANLVLPGGTLSGSLQTTPSSNIGQTGTVNLAASMLEQGQASPNFFTTGGIIDNTSPFSEIEKVSYILIPATNQNLGLDLFRSVTRNLLAVDQEQPIRQALLSGVQTLVFSYYDGSQWRNSWDSTVADTKTGLTNTLPAAIKVQISMAAQVASSRRNAVNPIELVVPIVVRGLTNTVAVAEEPGGGT